MADNGGHAGRRFAIAGAFAGQAAIFLGIGALMTATAATSVVPVGATAVPAPVVASLLPVVSTPDLPLPATFRYTVSIDGQAGGGMWGRAGIGGQPPITSYRVPAGQELDVTLGVTVPASLKPTGLTMGLAEAGPAQWLPDEQTVYDLPSQPLLSGSHTYVVNWLGSAGELRPGTTWLLFLSVTTSAGEAESPIATLTVAS
jgi:hypothetical protein